MNYYVICACLLVFSNLTAVNEVLPDLPPEKLYLDLIKRCITDTVYKDRIFFDHFKRPELKNIGPYIPSNEQTMMYFPAADKLQELIEDVLANQVPGDFIETGVWRGGLTILMRACLKAYGDTTRTVWVADSFAGLPKPSNKLDKPYDLSSFNVLAVSLEQVKSNFGRYGLLDDQVRFLKGWFKDTLPTAPVKSLAILRLDGDYYESTMDALNNLYHKVSVGGYVIIDDYGAIPVCAQAVTEFRAKHGITDVIYPVDWTGVYWQKTHL